MQHAGSNATAAFDEVHAPDLLEELPKDTLVGFLQQASPDVPAAPTQRALAFQQKPEPQNKPNAPAQPDGAAQAPPPLQTILSAPDLELAAEKALTPKAWAFYSSAATDLVTHRRNKELLRRIMIRPRVLKNVTDVSLHRRILGLQCEAPIFVSPTAMARLAHPDGERALSRGAANEGIIQIVSRID